MKEYLTTLVEASPSQLQAVNDAREYLQARILGMLQRRGAFIPLAFHGGTALRFLFSTARYSEDLDFTLEGGTGDYDFREYLRAIEGDFTAEGYEVRVKVNDTRVVNSAFVRFPGLPGEVGLSPDRRGSLAVKIEVDTNPPKGVVLETTVVRCHLPLHLHHHDRASLLAGKLHAVLQRPWLKGRDIYDLLWYLGDPGWPPPNLELLNNALDQSGWEGGRLDRRNWRPAVLKRLGEVDWNTLGEDVRPFLGHGVDPSMLSRENLVRLLG